MFLLAQTEGISSPQSAEVLRLDDQYELRGVVKLSKERLFSIYDKRHQSSRWLRMNQAIGFLEIDSYDDVGQILTVTDGKQYFTLHLKTADETPVSIPAYHNNTSQNQRENLTSGSTAGASANSLISEHAAGRGATNRSLTPQGSGQNTLHGPGGVASNSQGTVDDEALSDADELEARQPVRSIAGKRHVNFERNSTGN